MASSNRIAKGWIPLAAVFLTGATVVFADGARWAGLERERAIAQKIEDWFGDGAPRLPGSPANLALESRVADVFAASGVEHGEMRFAAPAFQPGETVLDLPGKGTVRLRPMHPTLFRPGNFRETAFETELLDMGRGTAEDLAHAAGTDLNGKLVLMDFHCGRNWSSLLRFGVRGFVFVGAEDYAPRDAYDKVPTSEVAAPRFFVSAREGARLRAFLRERETAGMPVRVRAEPSRWEERELRNLWAFVPGSDPLLRDEVVVITAPMDANCVVPELAEGAENAGNLLLLLDLFEAFQERPPARSVLFAAVNARTHNYLGDRVLAWYLAAPQESIETVRNELSDDLRLQEMLAGHLRKLRFSYASRADDSAFLVQLRSLVDDSIGRQVTVKEPLVSLSKRDVNQAKETLHFLDRDIRQAEQRIERLETQRARAPDASDRVEREIAETAADVRDLTARKRDLEHRLAAFIKVLTLFNRVGLQTRLEDLTPEETRILRDYVENVIRRNETWAALNRRDLSRSEKNGGVRSLLAGRRLALYLSLEHAWRDDTVAFGSGSEGDSASWAARWGRNTTRISRAMSESFEGGRRNLLVDSLTFFNGLPERFYVPGASEAIRVYHRAGRVPALGIHNPFVYSGKSFTPANRIENLDIRHVAEVSAFVENLLYPILSDPGICSAEELPPPPIARETLWSGLVGTFKFDKFSAGVTPRIPVPGSAILLTPPHAPAAGFTGGGVISSYMALSDERAYTLFYGVRERSLCGNAFRYDSDFITVNHAVDAGETHQKLSSNISPASRRILSMIECREFTVSDRDDPSFLGASPIKVEGYFPLSARRNSELRRYAVSGASSVFSSKLMPVNAWGPVGFYFPEHERLKIITENKRLAVNADAEAPEGRGFAVSDRAITDFFDRVRRDLDRVNRHRLKAFQGVSNQLIDDYLERSERSGAGIEQARASQDHLARLRHLFEGLGAQVKAYEQIASIRNDMLKAVVFYMALLLPFCFFIQKLLFKSVRIEIQLGWFALLFVACYVAFRFMHPAFRVARAPEAMFIAFVMGGLGLFVIWILHGRFEGEMQLLFHSLSGHDMNDVGYSMVGQQAMLIGVNNMKRRRVRTMLTTATIVLVTFTMLAFTSVSKRLSPTLIARESEAPYTGLMYHWPGALRMDEASRTVLEQMFAEDAQVLTRRWLMPQDERPSGSAFRLSTEGEKTAMLDGILGLEPEEDGFLGAFPLNSGRFFSASDADEILLSRNLVRALDLDFDAPGTIEFVLRNRRLRLVGVVDDAALRSLEDINGRPILPIKKRVEQQTGGEAPKASDTDPETLVKESGVFYVDTPSLAILPGETARRMGATPYSVSVRFPDRAPIWPALDRFLTATRARCFMASRAPFALGEAGNKTNNPGVYYVGGGYRTAIGGLSMLIVPLLIASTIILNTMLGSVFERKKEIAVYNAVGLNPTHIGLFFLAESLVYGIIGSVGGYMIGQALSILLSRFGWIEDINLNFSSLSVAYVILFTISVVLLSTLYPALVATRAAVPSGKRKWSMPDHDGQSMTVVFPFIYQDNLVPGVMTYLDDYFARFSEASTGDMIAERIGRSTRADEDSRPVFRLAYHVALAPFDLGVTQEAVFEASFDRRVEAYRIVLRIERVSGQDSNWVSTNKPFLERLRKLLLYWRNLKPAEHEVFLRRGISMFETGDHDGVHS